MRRKEEYGKGGEAGVRNRTKSKRRWQEKIRDSVKFDTKRNSASTMKYTANLNLYFLSFNRTFNHDRIIYSARHSSEAKGFQVHCTKTYLELLDNTVSEYCLQITQLNINKMIGNGFQHWIILHNQL